MGEIRYLKEYYSLIDLHIEVVDEHVKTYFGGYLDKRLVRISKRR